MSKVKEEEWPLSTFRQLLAEQHYNFQLLEEHRLAEDQLETEHASEIAFLVMLRWTR